MKTIATVKLKIPCKKEILETMKQYAKSAQYVVDVGWNNVEWNKRKLHDLTYYKVREITKLPAQLVCSSRDKAVEALKALRKIKRPNKPRFKEFLTIRYDARSFSFKCNNDRYYISLVTVNGRIKFPIEIPEYYWKYLDMKICNADLIFDRKKRMFLNIVFSRDINTPINSHNVFLGVDVGINHIAVTSNRQFFSGNKIKSYRLKFKRLKTKLQAKGTQSAKRLLKKISGKERRFKAWVNHNISKQIVSNCRAGSIVLENIKGIRANKGRKFNFWLHGWSFFQLQQFIEYKAIRNGIRVIKVSPYHTSKICSKCGTIGSRSKGFFTCHCGYSLNADLNGAINIASKHHSISDGVSVVVTKPYIRTDELEGSARTIESEVMDKSSTA